MICSPEVKTARQLVTRCTERVNLREGEMTFPRQQLQRTLQSTHATDADKAEAQKIHDTSGIYLRRAPKALDAAKQQLADAEAEQAKSEGSDATPCHQSA